MATLMISPAVEVAAVTVTLLAPNSILRVSASVWMKENVTVPVKSSSSVRTVPSDQSGMDVVPCSMDRVTPSDET